MSGVSPLRHMRRMLSVIAVAIAFPSAAFAQASIAGVVRDTSGAVLPGVTVEAASPALIEKVRSAVSDGNGQFRITELRPGTYTVTFSLAGFSTVRRDGVVLQGETTAQVNADLRVGSLEETITVVGEAPVVDTQSTTRQQVLSREAIDTLPTGRNYQSLGAIIPGVTSNTPDGGGALGDTMASLTVHGSRTTDQRVMQNGVNTMTLQAGGNIGIAVPNPGMAAEVTIDTASVSAEQAVGGVRINYIPRDGGNQFAGNVYLTFANEDMQGENLSDELRARGLTRANSIKKLWDFNPGLGGPIVRDRLWFFTTFRYNGAHNYAAGMFYNRNAYKPNLWTYEPDTSRPAANLNVWKDAQIRLTSQVSPRNKVAFTWDQQFRCSCPGGIGTTGVTATRSPEAAPFMRSPVQRLLHSEWTSPLTSRVLMEAAGLHRTERWGFMHPNSAHREDFISAEETALLAQMIPVTEQSTGLQYRSRPTYNNTWVPNYFFRFATSYVTGSHAIKVGFTEVFGFHDQTDYTYHAPIEFRLLNGVPNRITQRALPIRYKSDLNHDLGIFAQDKWTVGRLTASFGARFDYFKSSFPEQTLGPAQLSPGRNLTFPAQDNISWKDITPRAGLVYDVTGDGKTAVKLSLNKYLASQTLDGLGRNPNPVLRLVTTANRSWNDLDRDFVPDCDLISVEANGECGALDNRNFGSPSTAFQTFDPDVLTGWGNRGFNWELAAGLQREIAPRMSVDVGYFRRWYGNHRITDNLALTAGDFDEFSIETPSAPGLPAAGRLTGLYDVKPAKFGQSVQHDTLARKYGDFEERYDGVDVTTNWRSTTGLTLSGGLSTGKTTVDLCDVARQVPETLLLRDQGTGNFNANVRIPLQWCRQVSPFLTQFKLFGSYTIPVIDVLLSGTLQSVPGPEIRADFAAPNAAIMPSLGRPLAGGLPNQTIAVIRPASEYGERLNQVDVRLGKVVRAAGLRTSINVDIFNLLNTATVLSENANFTAFRRPTGIALARYFKIGASVEF